jgi:hypothetical protein
VSTPEPAPEVAQARLLVEQAMQALREAEHSPVSDQVGVLDGVHRCLQDALAALDEA